MEVVLRSTVFLMLCLITTVVTDTKIPSPELSGKGTGFPSFSKPSPADTKTSGPQLSGTGTGVSGFSKSSPAEYQGDLSRLSLAELVAQAKEDVKKTHDALEAARGINLVKNLSDESNQKMDQSCLRALGQALMNVTKSAEQTQKAAQFKAKEIEKRLATEKKSIGPAPTLPALSKKF